MTITVSLPLGNVILVLLMCQAIAAIFIVIFAVLSSILVAAFLEQKRALEMDQGYDELVDSREVFWDALNLAYGRFRESNPQTPEQLGDLILADGFPSGFEPKKVKNPAQWLNENKDKLDQFTIWKFASSIYPTCQDQQSIPIGHDLIESAHAEPLHEARGKLTRFWNKWVPLNEWIHFIMYPMPMRYLYKHYPSAHNQLIMLTWLELALIARMEDHGRRRIALFRVAASFARKFGKS